MPHVSAITIIIRQVRHKNTERKVNGNKEIFKNELLIQIEIAVTLLQLHYCSYTIAVTLLQLHYCSYTIAVTLLRLHYCSYTIAVTLLHHCSDTPVFFDAVSLNS